VLRASDWWPGRGVIGHRGLAVRLPRLSGADNHGAGSSGIEEWWSGARLSGCHRVRGGKELSHCDDRYQAMVVGG
jgi:hypothetical protein